MFVPTYAFTIIEYDPDRPWVLLGEQRRETVDLDDDTEFWPWANAAWPRDRYRVELDPRQFARGI